MTAVQLIVTVYIVQALVICGAFVVAAAVARRAYRRMREETDEPERDEPPEPVDIPTRRLLPDGTWEASTFRRDMGYAPPPWLVATVNGRPLTHILDDASKQDDEEDTNGENDG